MLALVSIRSPLLKVHVRYVCSLHITTIIVKDPPLLSFKYFAISLIIVRFTLNSLTRAKKFRQFSSNFEHTIVQLSGHAETTRIFFLVLEGISDV